MRYRGLNEQSPRRFASEVDASTMPVEAARANLILVAGGDALWPLESFARSIVERGTKFGKQASLLYHREAGHRILLPGEPTARSALHAHDGNDRADTELGDAAWAAITEVLNLRP